MQAWEGTRQHTGPLESSPSELVLALSPSTGPYQPAIVFLPSMTLPRITASPAANYPQPLLPSPMLRSAYGGSPKLTLSPADVDSI